MMSVNGWTKEGGERPAASVGYENPVPYKTELGFRNHRIFQSPLFLGKYTMPVVFVKLQICTPKVRAVGVQIRTS